MKMRIKRSLQIPNNHFFTQYKDVINKMTESSTTSNMTADSFGISREYALKDYNITSEDLDAAIENVKDSNKKE
jgi:hypothetical protein